MGNVRGAHVDPARGLCSRSVCINFRKFYGAVYTAVCLLRLRSRDPQRSLTERFFCRTRKNRERWLVSIYRSMTQCRKMWLRQLKLSTDPHQCKHSIRVEKSLLHTRVNPLHVGVNTPLIRSRTTLKFWSATMYGAAARNFGPVHKFGDCRQRATSDSRIFIGLSGSRDWLTGHMVSHMVPMARCRPPYWKIFAMNNLATVF